MNWEVWVEVSMVETGEDNMPVDLKTVADLIDEVDHACLLNQSNEMLLSQFGPSTLEELFGDVIWFNGDPTCEVMAKWMATRIYEQSEAIENVELEVAETDKYSISAEHP
jgi:6-pyruvoyl-tetrahydropterin synthase